VLLASDREPTLQRLTKDIERLGCKVIVADHRGEELEKNMTSVYSAVQVDKKGYWKGKTGARSRRLK